MNRQIRTALRALRSTARMVASGGRGVLLEVGGERFRVTPETAAAADTRYEQGKYEAVMGAIEDGMTVFDIGAHHGLYALGMASRAGTRGRVVAFEPNPESARILRRNVELNPDASIMVIPVAVCDEEGESELWIDDSDLTSSSLAESGTKARPLRVKTITLDSFCAGTRLWPQIIKIDVEGAELRVLDGGRKLLASPETRSIHIEIHSGMGIRPEEVIARGEALGFQVLDYLGRPIPTSARASACHIQWRREPTTR